MPDVLAPVWIRYPPKVLTDAVCSPTHGPFSFGAIILPPFLNAIALVGGVLKSVVVGRMKG
jgi:hypothetical protein